MTTPNFKAVAADIRDHQAEAKRLRDQLDNDALRARDGCKSSVIRACNVIDGGYVGDREALVILHAVLRWSEHTNVIDQAILEDLRHVCLGLADAVFGEVHT